MSTSIRNLMGNNLVKKCRCKVFCLKINFNEAISKKNGIKSVKLVIFLTQIYRQSSTAII